MSDAPLTPDELTTKNELICEKLLGWIRHNYPANDSPAWEVPSKAGEFQPTVFVTPSFTTWTDAGLILDAMARSDLFPDLNQGIDHIWKCSVANDLYQRGDTGPLAIRAAALEYIRSLP